MHSVTGFLIALAGTVISHVGFVLLKKGAGGLSRITWRLSLDVAREFLRCRIWLLGTLMQMASFAAYAVALALAPVSVVQPVTSAGILVLVFLAVVHLKERLSAPEWASIGLVMIGLPILGLSLGSSEAVPSHVPHLALLAFSAGALAAAGMALAIVARVRESLDWGVALGLITGVLYGISTLVLKALTIELTAWPRVNAVMVAYAVAVIAFNVVPYVLMQAAFQRGRAATVVPTMSALTAALPVLGGVWVFAERLPSSPAQEFARIAGVGAILLGAIALSRFSAAALPDEIDVSLA